MKHGSGHAYRRSRLGFPGLAVGVLACFGCCGVCLAQAAAPKAKTGQSASTPTPSAEAKKAPPASSDSSTAPADAAQAQLIAETDKLLQLSRELKAAVAKSSKDTLSIEVVKKAEEVEKLARSLKEQMNKGH